MVLGNRSTDLTGQQFGSLTAVKPIKVHNRMVHWLFKCVCGKEIEARGNTVTHQAKKQNGQQFPSCGCKELEQKTKHGFRKASDTHPAYKVYRGMMTRCYDSNNDGYKWYGFLGVSVCAKWLNNPEAFIQWALNNGWQKGLHIDKDILCKAKGIYPHVYSPETCQWVTAKVNVGFATNRDNFGKHPNVRLSHEDVANIIKDREAGTSGVDLSRKYGVGTSAIYQILKKHRAESNDSV